MRGIARPVAVLLLALATFAALPGAAAPLAQDLSSTEPTDSTTETPTPTDGGLLSDVDDTLDETTDTVDSTTGGTLETTNDTVDDTTDAVDTTNDTVDTTNDTLDDTTDAVDSTTDDTVDATNDTVDATNDAVSDTTDAVDDTTDATLDVTDETVDGTTDLLGATTSALTDADAGVSDVLGETASVGDEEPMLGPGDAATDGSASLVDEADGIDPDRSTGESGDDGAPAIAAASGPAGVQVPTDPGPLAAGATAVTGVGAVAVGTMLGTGSGVEREVTAKVANGLERLVRTVAPFRYSRYDGSDPLEHEDRAAINDYVRNHPGAYVSAVSQAVGVPHSTARHHVKVLEREGLVENAKVRGRRRLFPAHAGQQELAAAMTDEATAAILDAIARLGPCSGTALAEEVDRSVGTVSHHLSRLEQDGLVVREKDGRTTVNSLPSDVREALAPEQEVAGPDARAVSAD